MNRARREVAEVICAIARRSHGVVQTRDLLAAGLDPETVRRHVGGTLRATGRRGVYVVAVATDAWTPAALELTRSSSLALTGRAGAAVYGWDGFDRPDGRLLEEPPLVCPWTSRADLRPYRRKDLVGRDIWLVDGLRVPRPSWLLARLGEDRHVDVDRLELAVEAALRWESTTEAALWAEVGAGGSLLWEVLERRGRGAPPTGSMLETLTVQRVLRPYGIEVIGRQVQILARGQFLGRPDFLLAEWTVLEVDGGQHLTDEHRRADRTRDLRMGSAGLMVIRVGPEDVREAAVLASRLTATISARRGYPRAWPQAAASSPVANAAHNSA